MKVRHPNKVGIALVAATTALVLGAGFASKSEAVGGNIRVLPWDARADALKDAALLVNSTNLGMAGQAPLEIDLAKLPSGVIVYDIVYVPLMTELLKAARQRGNRIVDGIGMLLHQARPGFKAWFGQDAQVTPELRAFVLGT